MNAHPNSDNFALLQSVTLPSAVRYKDDFGRETRSIRDLASSDNWQIMVDGLKLNCNFGRANPADRPLLKRWLVDLITEIKPRSAHGYFASVIVLGSETVNAIIRRLAEDHPSDFRTYWLVDLRPKLTIAQVRAVRSLCRTFCNHGYGQWSPDHLDFVANLKGYPLDKYAVVASGDCFVDLYDQSVIAQSLDDLAERIKIQPSKVSLETLRGAIILSLTFQHGLRSLQIASITAASVKLYPTGAVHFKFPVAKQRRSAAVQERLRSVRREWCPIFIEFQKRRKAARQDIYFLGRTPDEIRADFKAHLEYIGAGDWSITDLRHTAAQRLADSGASHAAITEFMSHADLATALVYIKASPTQAGRVNQALGASDIFSVVAKAARTGIISRHDLDNVPDANLIVGIPHGVPLGGIGACKAEVGLCSKNPVVSCYTCHKFLAVADTSVHEEVVSSLRKIVLDFARMARPGETSPAMAQLRATLEAAQSLIDHLEEGAAQ